MTSNFTKFTEALAELPSSYLWHLHRWTRGRVVMVGPEKGNRLCGGPNCIRLIVDSYQVITPDPTDNPGTGG